MKVSTLLAMQAKSPRRQRRQRRKMTNQFRKMRESQIRRPSPATRRASAARVSVQRQCRMTLMAGHLRYIQRQMRNARTCRTSSRRPTTVNCTCCLAPQTRTHLRRLSMPLFRRKSLWESMSSSKVMSAITFILSEVASSTSSCKRVRIHQRKCLRRALGSLLVSWPCSTMRRVQRQSLPVRSQRCGALTVRPSGIWWYEVLRRSSSSTWSS
mmetsp:Transcript_62510/g.109260  ORF Transcript_62510/g.109260 Transcript_62510/m.109260 type:complete len:212 (+) Transcript_62510:756-1391(+)